MAELNKYLDAAGFGLAVNSIVGNTVESAKATGYGAWVDSLTGTYPKIVSMGNGRAKILLTEQQIVIMRKWVDSQITSFLKKPDTTGPVSYELNAIIMPTMLKYTVPIAAFTLIVGWLLHYYMGK